MKALKAMEADMNRRCDEMKRRCVDGENRRGGRDGSAVNISFDGWCAVPTVTLSFIGGGVVRRLSTDADFKAEHPDPTEAFATKYVWVLRISGEWDVVPFRDWIIEIETAWHCEWAEMALDEARNRIENTDGHIDKMERMRISDAVRHRADMENMYGHLWVPKNMRREPSSNTGPASDRIVSPFWQGFSDVSV